MDDLQYALRHYWARYRGAITLLIVLLLCVTAAGSAFYKVNEKSEGVVLRCGEHLKTTGPGLHFKLPWPIDTVYKVPVKQVQSLEFGRRTLVPGRKTQYAPPSEDDKTMARMLTADLNLAHVEWVVQYLVSNPRDYLFNIGGEPGGDAAENARELIQDASEAVMRRIVGDKSIDSVITTGGEGIADQAQEELQAMLNGFKSGIKIEDIKLVAAQPPEKVKDAFDAVNRAEQIKERIVNEAKGERNKKIPAARGLKDRAIAEAQGYALRVTMEAQGQANAFLSKLAEYEKAPAVTRTRLYLEAMEEIFAQVQDKVVIDESVKGMLPLLHLGSGTAGSAPTAQRGKGGAR
jgi:membrane protease subunit HflK